MKQNKRGKKVKKKIDWLLKAIHGNQTELEKDNEIAHLKWLLSEQEAKHKKEMREADKRLNARCEKAVNDATEYYKKQMREAIEEALRLGWNNAEHPMWEWDGPKYPPSKLIDDLFKKYHCEEKEEKK